MVRPLLPCSGLLLVLSLACAGADPMATELDAADAPSVAPDLDDASPEERVAAALRSSDAPLSADCRAHAPDGMATIGQWVVDRDAAVGALPPRCAPCTSHEGQPFSDQPEVPCDDTAARGQCGLFWPSSEGIVATAVWLVDERFAPLPDSCVFDQEVVPLDAEELEEPDASERVRLPGAPVEGIRYWAPAGELEYFLASREASRPKRTVEVSDVEGLIRALADDTLILLAPGRYVFDDADPLGNGTAKADWAGLSPHYVDHVVRGVDNLVIAAATSEPTVLIQPDAYASVIRFQNVDHVGLFGLTIGHRPEIGWCMGDVVQVAHASDFAISHCTLFGSGTKGLTAADIDGLRLADSVITDSSEGFADISRSRGVRLERVKVAGNTAELLRGFTIHASELVFDQVVMEDNHALQHSADPSMGYGRLLSVEGFDPAWMVEPPFRVEAREGTDLTLIDVTVDGRAITWPP